MDHLKWDKLLPKQLLAPKLPGKRHEGKKSLSLFVALLSLTAGSHICPDIPTMAKATRMRNVGNFFSGKQRTPFSLESINLFLSVCEEDFSLFCSWRKKASSSSSFASFSPLIYPLRSWLHSGRIFSTKLTAPPPSTETSCKECRRNFSTEIYICYNT